MESPKKILIIKMGYSETLDSETSRVVSLGDVLRCTVLLEPLKDKFPHSQITWLVSHEAMPLVSHNRYIDRLLIWDEFVPYVLMCEQYDIVINLEKIAGVCALVDMIHAWEKTGFRFDGKTGNFDTYMQSIIAKNYIQEKDAGGDKKIWQAVILEMIGLQWKAQPYVLGYEPTSLCQYDVGLNYKVGSKWPTKAMPYALWEKLARLLESKGLRISWQEGQDNLYDYMEWIHSCKTLISCDSLGLHLAFAMKKQAIGLFGATDAKELFFYNESLCVTSSLQAECKPCYKPKCMNQTFCMEYFDLEDIATKIVSIVHNQRSAV